MVPRLPCGRFRGSPCGRPPTRTGRVFPGVDVPPSEVHGSPPPRLILLLTGAAILVLAGCTAGCTGGSASDPGGATGNATVSSTVTFEADCEAASDECAVTATLASTDGTTDVAVHLRDHDTHETLHTFDAPADQVGHHVTLTVVEGAPLEVVLERPAGSEVTQLYAVEADR